MGKLLKKRVLVICYSYTGQTRLLVRKYIAGLEDSGIEVAVELLEPELPYEFPFKSNIRLIAVMIMTFFRKRSRIRKVSQQCSQSWDRIVLAGPTWSYHPSGPVLDFLDRFGKEVCGGNKVTPFISCRSYWRIHYWSLKRTLKKCDAVVASPIVFSHPIREPFRFIGLLLQLRGKMMRKQDSWFRKYYPGYGHNRDQVEEAYKAGERLAIVLK